MHCDACVHAWQTGGEGWWLNFTWMMHIFMLNIVILVMFLDLFMDISMLDTFIFHGYIHAGYIHAGYIHVYAWQTGGEGRWLNITWMIHILLLDIFLESKTWIYSCIYSCLAEGGRVASSISPAFATQ